MGHEPDAIDKMILAWILAAVLAMVLIWAAIATQVWFILILPLAVFIWLSIATFKNENTHSELTLS